MEGHHLHQIAGSTIMGMDYTGWTYIIFTGILAFTMLGIILHYYKPGKQADAEAPKYAMLDDDDEKS